MNTEQFVNQFRNNPKFNNCLIRGYANAGLLCRKPDFTVEIEIVNGSCIIKLSITGHDPDEVFSQALEHVNLIINDPVIG